MSFGKTNGDSDALIQSMLQQIKGNEHEAEKIKMIYTIVSAQIFGPLLAAEYQHGLDEHLKSGGDAKDGFAFNATRAYGTAKKMALAHMQEVGWDIGIKPKPKIQE